MENEGDIYRGEDERHQVLEESPPSVSSSSTKSLSSSLVAGGRIGAIAAKLELAISRWAKHVRGSSSASSSSSSTTSSLSSRPTLSRSQLSRKRRRSRAPSFSSEREIALRITRLMALRESRQILRGFTLYLPPSLVPSAIPTVFNTTPHISSTTSLSDLLTQLEAPIRFLSKRRRQRHRTRGPKLWEGASSSQSQFRFLSPDDSVLTSNFTTTRGRKGKQHENMVKPARISDPRIPERQAWFLDVSSPTWADLQAIGKLLHIHPLTLEDILQKDPREKVEDFPNLGYYFVSFRTAESQATRERVRREAGLLDSSMTISQGLDEGSIGETNVYLTIFIDGICCFHYTDVSEHTDRIRNMMLLLENNVNRTSDWIAHTILDSIVDSFFPILDEIDQEVRAIDQTVFTDTASSQLQDLGSKIKLPLPVPSAGIQPRPAEKPYKTELTNSEKRAPTDIIPSYRTRFTSPRLSVSLLLRRARRHFNTAWRGFCGKADTPSATQVTLRRMARVKKLIAVLGRLLNSKSDVMTGIKKRLIKSIEARPDGTALEEVEIAMYMTDIQDHILALQLSLAHNERMLIHSHPAYMSNLRSELEMTKSGIDIKVLYLSTATITVLCIQTVTGIFSMNCHVPHNKRHPEGRYIVFGLVLAAAATITVSMFALVHHWWKKAKRRPRASL